jgi:hypothetical protein
LSGTVYASFPGKSRSVLHVRDTEMEDKRVSLAGAIVCGLVILTGSISDIG